MTDQTVDTDTLVGSIRASIEIQHKRGKLSTARKLIYCLQKVEKYLDGSELPLADINKEWIDGFADWMIRREELSENTKATYLRLIYTVCRTAAANGAAVDTSAFDTEEMSNSESTRTLLTIHDIQQLMDANLDCQPVLERARDLWLFSFLCGGVSMTDMMKATPEMLEQGVLSTADGNVMVTDASRSIAISHFCGKEYAFHSESRPLDDAEIKTRTARLNSLLEIIAEKARIEKPVTIDSTRSTWLNIARIKGDRVNDTASDRLLFNNLLREVAALVDQDRRYWFAMRCLRCPIEDMSEKISSEFPSSRVFIAESDSYESTAKGVKRVHSSVIRDILFFNTTLSQAELIKRRFRETAYTYDYRSGTSRRLAIIPDAEMKMFMYINHITSREIAWFFPEETKTPEFQKGCGVIITDGEWKGARGTYLGPSPRFPLHIIVSVVLENLNIGVSAHIPHHFVRLV